MTLEEKINLGLKCHIGEKHPCDECPYHPEPDIMLDPRIDPDYDRHVIDLTKDCRDKLISDMAKEFERLNNENANLKIAFMTLPEWGKERCKCNFCKDISNPVRYIYSSRCSNKQPIVLCEKCQKKVENFRKELNNDH